MSVRRLPETVINRIAAGEVDRTPGVGGQGTGGEQPRRRRAAHFGGIRDGGKSLIAVTDDGAGMSPEDLELAIERHATSKLPDHDLHAIASLGFRGEALPSIGAVSRLAITTRAAGDDSAWRLPSKAGRNPARSRRRIRTARGSRFGICFSRRRRGSNSCAATARKPARSPK